MATFIKVYKDSDGLIRVLRGSRTLAVSSPSSLSVDYLFAVTGINSDNRATINRFGQAIVSGIPIDAFLDEDGNKISPNVDWEVLHAYFVGLGFSESSGGGITPEELAVILQGYVTKEEYDTQIAFILSQLGITQLDTPILSADTPTSSSVNVNIGQVDNGVTYRLFRDGENVYEGTFGVVPQTGLSPDTQYTYTAQVIADGYAPSDLATLIITTAPAQQTQLPSGTLQVGTVTENSIAVTGSVVPNAELYRFIRNGTVITTQSNPSYTFTGLNPSSNYTLGRIAIANGYLDSSVVQVNAQTQPETPTTSTFPLVLPFQLSA